MYVHVHVEGQGVVICWLWVLGTELRSAAAAELPLQP